MARAKEWWTETESVRRSSRTGRFEVGFYCKFETRCSHPWHRNPALITPCPDCNVRR